MASDSSDQFDWEKCVVCQRTTTEKLQCPANNKRSHVDVGIGYETLAKNIECFQQLGCTSISVPATSLKLTSDSPLADIFKENHTNVMNKDERVEPGERDGAASQDARHKVRVKTARANRPGGSALDRYPQQDIRESCLVRSPILHTVHLLEALSREPLLKVFTRSAAIEL